MVARKPDRSSKEATPMQNKIIRGSVQPLAELERLERQIDALIDRLCDKGMCPEAIGLKNGRNENGCWHHVSYCKEKCWAAAIAQIGGSEANVCDTELEQLRKKVAVLEGIVLDNAGVIGCPGIYGISKRLAATCCYGTPCRECWTAALTQVEGGEV